MAWRNLIADRVRFAVTLTGIAFAVLLMILEGSLLVGFARAASNLVNASGADIWVTARGVKAFDLPAPLPDRFRDLVRGVDGVERADRLVAGFTSWRAPSGDARTVLLVGADRGIRGRFPHPRLGESSAVAFESVVIDASNAKYLNTTVVPVEVELGTPRKRAVVRAVTRGFGTFLGPPYVFTEYDDALAYLGWSPEHTAFIAVDVSDTRSLESVKRGIRAKLPEADVWSGDEFASSSSSYWLIQTGAGGALLTAATLGFLVGLVIVSQNMYAITLEHIEEFATLKALGASNVNVATIVSLQALISGAIGTAIGMIAAVPGVGFASNLISWIFLPGWLAIMVAAIGIAMCLAAGLVAVRPAMNIDPARVFRA